MAPPAPAAAADEEEEAPELAERVFLPPDRSIRQLLDRAEQLLAQQRFSEAVQALQTVLNAPEDYFYRPQQGTSRSGDQTYRSIKSEARRLIGKLPPGGRRSYDLQFGPAARRKLEQAVAAGNMEGVAEVSRQYCHTEAAEEALILLGRYHLDQGRPLAAALCVEQVQRAPNAAVYEPELSLLLAASWARAGQPEKSAVLLEQIRRRWPDARVPKAEDPGQVVLLSSRPADQWIAEWSGDSRVARLSEEWNLFLGSASRTGSAAGGRPLTLRPCWRQRMAVDASAGQAIANYARQLFDQSTPSIPALYPLALGDVVLMRGAGRLAAVSLETGKIVWQTEPMEDSRPTGAGEEDVPELPEPARRGSTAPLEVWGDRTQGTLSADEDSVYAIEKAGFAVPGRGRQWVDPFGRRRNISSAEAALNVLSCYDVRTTPGKQRWTVGGPTGVEPKLRKACFLGPPLPMQGWLYVLAETGGEVRLVVLAADTGRLQWSQQLAVADDETGRDLERYRSGISPSFSDGVLICPTTAGAVVAIDLATRGLLWGYQYPRDARGESVRDPFAPFIRRTAYTSADSTPSGWRDSCPMIHRGRVLITPAESNQLHCLRLDNGQLEWKVERRDNVYVAAVHDDRVLVAGPEELSAIALSGSRKGEVVATLPLPSGELPSGRGCYTGSEYFLPLSTATGAEIARVDLSQWKIAEQISCRDGSAPGNLISYRGRIISQGPDFLQCYYQLDAVKHQVELALAKDSEDPAALALKAQVLMEEGQATKALPLLRRAFATYTGLAASPPATQLPSNRSRRNDALAQRVAVRELLVDGLLLHLKSHFEDRQAVVQELARLIDQPEERVRYLRIVAEGLSRGGDGSGALSHYFQLVELAGDGSRWVSSDAAHLTRLDRWLAARLSRIGQTESGSLRDDYNQRVAQRFDHITRKPSEDLLASHVTMFEQHPSANRARLSLASRNPSPETVPQRAQVLYRVLERGDDAARREATARLAQLLLEAERNEEAAVYYRRLADQWPNTPCLEGRTGRQLFDALPPGSPARRPSAVPTGWPVGAVKATQSSGESRYPLGYQPAAELVTSGPQIGEPVRVFMDVQQQMLSGLDRLGRVRWRMPLARDTEGNPFMVNRGLAAGRFAGHILILSLGTHVMAINTLQSGGSRGQGLLWMDECGAGGLTTDKSAEQEQARPWESDNPSEEEYGATLAQLGPVVAGGAVYLRSRELVCVDPVSGKRFWSRRDVAAGTELFGDDEILIAAPPEGEALILQSVDGTLLGRRKLPPPQQRWVTLGRNVVCLEEENGKPSSLRLFDSWTQKDVWRWPLGSGVKMALVDDSTAAILDRTGLFLVLDLTTGLPKFRRQLETEPALSALYVVPGADHLIVIANRLRAEDPEMVVESAHENGGPIINGRVFALDRRTGDLLWPSAALIEDYALVLEQPRDLPVVVFARRVSDRENRRQQTSFLFLDKRTGALATLVRDFARRISNFEIVGDEEKKTVSLHLRSAANTLLLTFTNEPAPPEPPFQSAGRKRKTEEQNVLGAALRELGKAVQKLAEPPANKQQQEKELFGE